MYRIKPHSRVVAMFVTVEVQNIQYALCKNFDYIFPYQISSRSFRSTLVTPSKEKVKKNVFCCIFTQSLPSHSFQNLLRYLVFIFLVFRKESMLELKPRIF